MTRAYLRLDPKFYQRKVVEQRYPLAAFGALTSVLCLAEEQPERGRFASERLLRLLMDEPRDGIKVGAAKWLTFLFERHDIVKLPDGRLYVDGWDEWQEGDVTVKERMVRVRSRKKTEPESVTVPTVTPVTAASVTVPSERLAVSGKPLAVSGRQDDADALDAYYRLTGSFPTPKIVPWLNEMAADHGEAAVSQALAVEWKADADRSSLLSRTQDRLRREAHESEKARREADRLAAEAERRRIEEMPPEKRAANMARLRELVPAIAKAMP